MIIINIIIIIIMYNYRLLDSMPQAPYEAHRRRVRAGNIAPRLAHFEAFPRLLSQLRVSYHHYQILYHHHQLRIIVCQCIKSCRYTHLLAQLLRRRLLVLDLFLEQLVGVFCRVSTPPAEKEWGAVLGCLCRLRREIACLL